MNFSRIVRFCGLMLLVFCLHPTSLFSQSDYPGRLEADIDALSIARGGYAVRVAYQHRHLRMGVATFNHRQPSLVVAERNVNVRTSGIGFGVDYFLRPARGLFAGLHATFHEEQLSRATNEDTATQNTVETSVQAGYRWAFGREEQSMRGLYLEMVLSVGTRPGAQPVSLGSDSYTARSVSVQPGLRMGYRF